MSEREPREIEKPCAALIDFTEIYRSFLFCGVTHSQHGRSQRFSNIRCPLLNPSCRVRSITADHLPVHLTPYPLQHNIIYYYIVNKSRRVRPDPVSTLFSIIIFDFFLVVLRARLIARTRVYCPDTAAYRCCYPRRTPDLYCSLTLQPLEKHHTTVHRLALPAVYRPPQSCTRPSVGTVRTYGRYVIDASMIMAWQPQEEGLRQIIQLLKESQSPDTVIQRTVQQVSFSVG